MRRNKYAINLEYMYNVDTVHCKVESLTVYFCKTKKLFKIYVVESYDKDVHYETITYLT
jgi:hypothetical protein